MTYLKDLLTISLPAPAKPPRYPVPILNTTLAAKTLEAFCFAISTSISVFSSASSYAAPASCKASNEAYIGIPIAAASPVAAAPGAINPPAVATKIAGTALVTKLPKPRTTSTSKPVSSGV